MSPSFLTMSYCHIGTSHEQEGQKWQYLKICTKCNVSHCFIMYPILIILYGCIHNYFHNHGHWVSDGDPLNDGHTYWNMFLLLNVLLQWSMNRKTLYNVLYVTLLFNHLNSNQISYRKHCLRRSRLILCF